MKSKTFRLTDAQAAWLESEAGRLGVSESEVARSCFPMDKQSSKNSFLEDMVRDLQEELSDMDKRISRMESQFD